MATKMRVLCALFALAILTTGSARSSVLGASLVESVNQGGDEWSLYRVTNLGPKAGNGSLGLVIEVDRQRHSAYVLNVGSGNLSVIDLDLGLVTGAIDLNAMLGKGVLTYQNMVLNSNRDELYVVGHMSEMMVIDLKTMRLVRTVDLGSAGAKWFDIGARENLRPIVVDRQGDRLFIANESSISILTLGRKGVPETMERIPVPFAEGPNNVSAIALAADEGKLYAASRVRKTVDVVDLGLKTVIASIGTSIRPMACLADPSTPFLYVAGYNTDETGSFVMEGKLLRINLETNTIDREQTIWANERSRLVLDGGRRELWVIGTSGPNSVFVVGLDGFKVSQMSYSSFMVRNPVNAARADQGRLYLVDNTNLMYVMGAETWSIEGIVELGANPRGIAVSEVYNQVYVGRGQRGGFLVLDAAGNILRTVEGPETQNITVDDEIGRLFITGAWQMRVLKLPGMELLRVDQIGASKYQEWGVYPAIDRSRMVLWLPSLKSDPATGEKGVLYEVNLLSGVRLDSIALEGSPHQVVLDGDERKAYVSFSSQNPAVRGTVAIIDLDDRAVTGSIDIGKLMPDPGPGQSSWTLGMGMDTQASHLLIAGRYWASGRLFVLDTATDEVIKTIETTLNGMARIVVAESVRRAYLDNQQILDLDSLKIVRSAIGAFQYGALNQVTNTLYAVNADEGKLSVYLGPAGTARQPPRAPDSLSVGAGDQSAALRWGAVVDSTLLGYYVYRQDQSGAPYTRLTPQPVTQPGYTDLDLVNGQTYSYAVSSVGRGYIESYRRTEVMAATPRGAGFRLEVLQPSVYVPPGGEATVLLSVEAVADSVPEVGLSLEGPANVVGSFQPGRFVPPQVAALAVAVGSGVPEGRYPLLLVATGGKETVRRGLTLEVTTAGQAESWLTLELDQGLVPIDVPVLASGRLRPALATGIHLLCRSLRSDTLVTVAVQTSAEGEYRAEFWPPQVGVWEITAVYGGSRTVAAAQSRAQRFELVAGQTRITCTTDLADTARTGWMATVKGRIFPNPGTVSLNLKLTRPDSSEERIEGVLSSQEGYYGHDVRMDQAGLWQVQASWGGNDRLVGAVSPVVSVPVEVDLGRVILVAGGEDRSADAFWPTSNYLANLAYQVLARRRLNKEYVYYLNDRSGQDVDGDGFKEDVDGPATLSGWAGALAWARARVGKTNPLYIYVIGAGSSQGVQLGGSEVLNTEEVARQVGELQRASGAPVTVMVEASHAGQYVRQVSSPGRQVLSSTGLGRASYQGEGYLSFSQFFLTDVYQGKSLQEAFVHARNIVQHLPGEFGQQEPGLEAEGNLIANQPGDYQQTANAFIGAPYELGDLSPRIRSTSLAAGGALGKAEEALPTVVEGAVGLPQAYGLAVPYPNPFNSAVVVEYALPAAGPVTVYDALGQRVCRLVDGVQAGGWYRVRWEGQDEGAKAVATGVYLVRLQAGDFQQVRKMVVAR